VRMENSEMMMLLLALPLPRNGSGWTAAVVDVVAVVVGHAVGVVAGVVEAAYDLKMGVGHSAD